MLVFVEFETINLCLLLELFQANIEIDSKNLIWIVGSTTKKIDDEKVSWDSDTKKTKLTLEPPPTEKTTYSCQYVGAETNSSATVEVLGMNLSA